VGRVLLIALALLAAALFVEPRWSASDRTLMLRLRRTSEVGDYARARSRDFGGWVVRAARDARELAPVGAAPPSAGGAGPETDERLTSDEQQRLDRLVEQKTREE
jgi:hypothetical protein